MNLFVFNGCVLCERGRGTLTRLNAMKVVLEWFISRVGGPTWVHLISVQFVLFSIVLDYAYALEVKRFYLLAVYLSYKIEI